MSAAIELIDVTKRYKDFAIENFNLKVPQGCITGFVGPNGAGKSTVIRLIMDVVKPNSGEIRLFGRPNRHADLRREIGFVYDDLYMYRDFTIKKLRSLMAPLYPNWDDNLYQKYLGKFGLPIVPLWVRYPRAMTGICTLVIFGLAVSVSQFAFSRRDLVS